MVKDVRECELEGIDQRSDEHIRRDRIHSFILRYTKLYLFFLSSMPPVVKRMQLWKNYVNAIPAGGLPQRPFYGLGKVDVNMINGVE